MHCKCRIRHNICFASRRRRKNVICWWSGAVAVCIFERRSNRFCCSVSRLLRASFFSFQVCFRSLIFAFFFFGFSFSLIPVFGFDLICFLFQRFESETLCLACFFSLCLSFSLSVFYSGRNVLSPSFHYTVLLYDGEENRETLEQQMSSLNAELEKLCANNYRIVDPVTNKQYKVFSVSTFFREAPSFSFSSSFCSLPLCFAVLCCEVSFAFIQ